jgi:hypothetical protein
MIAAAQIAVSIKPISGWCPLWSVILGPKVHEIHDNMAKPLAIKVGS